MSDTLEVHNVGDYEASFVPTIADFSRLDARFKLPDKTWSQIPEYADYGFAVFKLNQSVMQPATGFQMPRLPERSNPSMRRTMSQRGPVSNQEDHEFHPMAFSFPTRMPDAVFFPTVHIHDGEVHESEEFDHTLYLQPHPAIASELQKSREWQESSICPGRSTGPAEVIDPGVFAYKTNLSGRLVNIDTVLR